MEFRDGIMGEFRGHADVESLTLLSRSIILKVILHFEVGRVLTTKLAAGPLAQTDSSGRWVRGFI